MHEPAGHRAVTLLRKEVQARLWDPTGCYLDTATYGLAATPTYDAVRCALDEWRTGEGDWQEWNRTTEPARAAWARLTAVAVDTVAVGANVSGLVGLVPRSLPDGAEVLVPAGEFTSALFPWLADGRLAVREVPRDDLAAAVGGQTAAVCFSLVRSSDGGLVDGDAVADACREVGAMTVVDVTQAGWLPFDGSCFDVVVGGAYKWLCCPRGTAFVAIADQVRERLVPAGAGWFAGSDPYGTFYGGPLRLAQTARAFDLSPAWLAWVGTAAGLQVMEEIGVEAIRSHDVELADTFRALVDLPPAPTPVVSMDAPGVEPALAEAGIRASVREGRLRLSFHVWNTVDDADLAARAVLRSRTTVGRGWGLSSGQ